MPQIPTGFNFTSEFHEPMNTTLVFIWDPLQGSGPETIVDNYVISIFPLPLTYPILNMVLTPPWNVTLSHNVAYNITIAAVNCAGVSTSFIFDETEYSESYCVEFLATWRVRDFSSCVKLNQMSWPCHLM